MLTTSSPSLASKGLRAGTLGQVATIVIGVGSTAPAYSLAASLGLVAGPVGLQAPAVLLLSFLPMFCVAIAYAAMNRREPDCGTTFQWVRRAMGPSLGWLGGWGILVADLLVMASLAQIAGAYSFQALGWRAATTSRPAVMAVGIGWILAMTWSCYRGIKTTARLQWMLLSVELFALLLLSAASLWSAFHGGNSTSVAPTLAWLNPFAINPAALGQGFLVAIFIYWGWDSAVAVNEESSNARHVPGRAAVISMALLVLIYVVAAVGAQSFAGSAFLASHADDVLSALARQVLPAPWDRMVALAVLISVAACMQTTILPTARTCLSMAAAGALPAVFGAIHEKRKTPHVATWAFGAASVVWYLVQAALGSDVLASTISALGLVIAFYLGLSSLACPLLHGRELVRSVRVFLLAGLLPSLGGGVFAWVLIASGFDLWRQPGPRVARVPVALLATGLLLGLGVVLMLLWRWRRPDYFRNRLR
jgi:amino acid transporter